MTNQDVNKTCVTNMEIKDIILGPDDHGILTLYIHLNGEGLETYYGGYALDTYSKRKEKRVGTDYGCQCIMDLMETFEVNDLYKLKGLYTRAVTDRPGLSGRVIGIGHIIKNKWFSFGDLAKEMGALE